MTLKPTVNDGCLHTFSFDMLQTTFSPTAREGNVFIHVCDSVHNQSLGYLVTAHPCWLLGHSLLPHGRYAFYWNAFLL